MGCTCCDVLLGDVLAEPKLVVRAHVGPLDSINQKSRRVRPPAPRPRVRHRPPPGLAPSGAAPGPGGLRLVSLYPYILVHVTRQVTGIKGGYGDFCF
jgi:hypothetical protein